MILTIYPLNLGGAPDRSAGERFRAATYKGLVETMKYKSPFTEPLSIHEYVPQTVDRLKMTGRQLIGDDEFPEDEEETAKLFLTRLAEAGLAEVKE